MTLDLEGVLRGEKWLRDGVRVHSIKGSSGCVQERAG